MKRQKTKRGLDPNYEVEMINKVKDYIRMEYSEEVYKKITSVKFTDIFCGYICNCLSLNTDRYTVPTMAHELVRFAKRSQ